MEQLVRGGTEERTAPRAFAVMSHHDHRCVHLVGDGDETIDRPAVHEFAPHLSACARRGRDAVTEPFLADRGDDVSLVAGPARRVGRRLGAEHQDQADAKPIGDRDSLLQRRVCTV